MNFNRDGQVAEEGVSVENVGSVAEMQRFGLTMGL
jgi:hypothetical protein